jgi:putative heme-binding domain-containing protein
MRPKLVNSPHQQTRLLARELDARFGNADSQRALLAVVSDARQGSRSRRRALDVLVETRFSAAAAALPDLVADPEIGGAAIRAMGALDSADTASILLNKFASLSPEARRQVIHVMAARPGLAGPLLQAVQRGRISRAEIDASAQRQLRNLRAPELREKIFAIWPQSDSSSSSKRQQFTRYKNLLTEERISKADLARGRVVYQQACGVCHKLYGEGTEIGPELTGSDRHNLDYLLENILSPSGVVAESYRASTITMKDERMLSGMVLGKTDQTLSIQTATEKVTVPVAEVDSIRESELSMMPDGLLDSLTEEQVIDLFGFLMSKTSPAPSESALKK